MHDYNKKQREPCKWQGLDWADVLIPKAAHFPHHHTAHSGSSGVILLEDAPGTRHVLVPEGWGDRGRGPPW